MTPRKIYRSGSDVKIAGVCGGLGAYFDIDPTLVRVFFVLLAFADGVGVWLYLLLWIFLPAEDRVGATFEENVRVGVEEITDRAKEVGSELQTGMRSSSQRASYVLGAVLILFGLFFLLESLNIFWFSTFRSLLWPVLLIFAGAFLLRRHFQSE
jgi:phage shock protein PspC (stress-responsive transcriptional regulator)